MPKVKINIGLSFILYVAFLMFIGRGVFLLTYLFVLFIHEYSHAFIAYKLGYCLTNITLSPFGICLNVDSNSIDSEDSVKIAIAGPCINFILAIFCMAIWWLNPSSYIFLQAFFEANVVIGTFNLLPCFPLDGGRVLKALLQVKKPRKVFNIINFIFAVIFIEFFFYFKYNVTFLMIAMFFIMSIFSFSKESKYDYMLYIDKKLRKVMKVKSYAIPHDLPLYKIVTKLSQNAFTVFLVIEDNNIIGTIYENQLKDIFEKNTPTTILKNIVLKK